MEIISAAYHFQLEGNITRCKEFGHGHINATYKVDTDAGKSYVVQKINQYVFHKPVELMANATAITEFIRKQVSDPRIAIHFIPAADGTYCHQDAEGEYWRAYEFMDGFCLEAPESEEDFYQSAIAFGRFQYLLRDFPADTLYETIPEFHNTIDRYRQFEASIAADAQGRAAEVAQDIAFLMENKERACCLQKMRVSGELPLRVTHNDTKLNNVLLDKDTRQALCVLDLDTVMPGLSLYDFGDSIRFGAATAAEDEVDVSKMKLDLNLFRVYTQGYLEANTALTEQEIRMLPTGAFVITVELATRFLKDYLDGDLYFKTAYPTHNLVRARSQIALAADMLEKWEEMERIVAQIVSKTQNETI